jgi:hypothetical protein
MNYSEFYALLARMPGASEGLKEELVSLYTKGRTTSLRQMEYREYRAMCNAMRGTMGMSRDEYTVEIKKRRSAVLKRMQKLGVDTTRWDVVDRFCLNPRIAGKHFAKLSLEELSAMIPKLENMAKKRREKVLDQLIDAEQICMN